MGSDFTASLTPTESPMLPSVSYSAAKTPIIHVGSYAKACNYSQRRRQVCGFHCCVQITIGYLIDPPITLIRLVGFFGEGRERERNEERGDGGLGVGRCVAKKIYDLEKNELNDIFSLLEASLWHLGRFYGFALVRNFSRTWPLRIICGFDRRP